MPVLHAADGLITKVSRKEEGMKELEEDASTFASGGAIRQTIH